MSASPLRQLLVLSSLFLCLTLPDLSGDAFAGGLTLKPRVVLVSSLDTKVPGFESEYYDHYIANLETIFRRHLDPASPIPAENEKFDIEVLTVRRADVHSLSQILRSPQNIAVLYIGHAGYASSTEMITDYYHNDLKDAFRKIHPNLKFLGIIGCSSEKIFTRLQERNFIQLPPGIVTFESGGKIDAKRGLTQAIRQVRSLLASRLGESVILNCSTDACSRRGFKLRIERAVSTLQSGPVSVTLRSQLLTTFPVGTPGERQAKEVWIDSQNIRAISDLKIVVNSGVNPLMSKRPIDLGQFKFVPLWEGSMAAWSLFSEKNGKAIGVATHIYRFSGKVPTDVQSEPYPAFRCLPQAPVTLASKWNNFEW